MVNTEIKKITYSACFLSIAMILPLVIGQIKGIGDSLLPMHIPILLCGFICGAKHGFVVGMITPVLRSIIFGMPPIFPNSLWMSLELATYGFVSGFMYYKKNEEDNLYTYICLLVSMICGRIVWGISKAILLGIGGSRFSFEMFVAGGFIDAFPGIVCQLIIIPLILKNIKRS